MEILQHLNLEILHEIFGGNSAATQFRLRECINLDKNMVSSENARNKLGEILHMPALGQMLISDNSATKGVNSIFAEEISKAKVHF